MSVRVDVPFAIIPEWLLTAEVGHAAIRLYAILWRFADTERRAHPSRRTLADRMGCSKDTIDRALRELVSAHALVVKRRKISGSKELDTNEYVLLTRPPSRTDAATGRGTDAATVGASQGQELEPLNESHLNESRASGPTDGEDPVENGTVPERVVVKNALVAACGWNPQHMTRDTWGRVEAAAKQLLEVGASQSDIEAFAYFWRDRYPDAQLTPQAISANWPAFQSGDLISTRRRK